MFYKIDRYIGNDKMDYYLNILKANSLIVEHRINDEWDDDGYYLLDSDGKFIKRFNSEEEIICLFASIERYARQFLNIKIDY